ncbi:hypothetical protein quinque_010499 [Culex quinquefasciatus]
MATPLPSNFSSHLCSVEVCDVQYNMRILKMKDSVEICSTTIMGEVVGCGSEDLAQKLARKLKKQVYLSANVPNDRIVRPSIERKLFEEINNNRECF